MPCHASACTSPVGFVGRMGKDTRLGGAGRGGERRVACGIGGRGQEGRHHQQHGVNKMVSLHKNSKAVNTSTSEAYSVLFLDLLVLITHLLLLLLLLVLLLLLLLFVLLQHFQVTARTSSGLHHQVANVNCTFGTDGKWWRYGRRR
ncbi:hypothetical protein E2C01_058491 [Portunus trituberculatus]|uniref:Uncharacterized protein n=1 Tax=Portunus trituberculatus TaxID=210409 RepID=A0A5B7H4U5_PORTR|nr:hypothetical protein [Portunus trituberculatus]